MESVGNFPAELEREIEIFSRRSADYRRQGRYSSGRALRGKITRKRGASLRAARLVYLPRIPRRDGFSTDSASASPQDSTDYTDSTNPGCCKSHKSNLRNPSAQSASVELESAIICASARDNPYNPENQNNPWKIRPSVKSVGDSSEKLKQWIQIFSRRVGAD